MGRGLETDRIHFPVHLPQTDFLLFQYLSSELASNAVSQGGLEIHKENLCSCRHLFGVVQDRPREYDHDEIFHFTPNQKRWSSSNPKGSSNKQDPLTVIGIR